MLHEFFYSVLGVCFPAPYDLIKVIKMCVSMCSNLRFSVRVAMVMRTENQSNPSDLKANYGPGSHLCTTICK